MLVVLVYVASFIVLLVSTLIVPVIPPGQMICNVFKNSEADYLIAGVSGEFLVSGIINGLIWGAVIILVYSFWNGPSKGKVDLPVWVPGYTTSRSSKIESKSPKEFKELSFEDAKNAREIELIEGIGYKYGLKLRKIGVTTVDDLLEVGYTKTGRDYLAKKVGVSQLTVLNWVRQAKAHS
jgi:predicted flap endonuclease-1-like 5' DNA nuclease